MDPMDRIDEIISVVEAARNVPMSRNCMMDRGEMIGLLEQLRSELPAELRRSVALLDERDKILDAGQREADRMISEARGRAPPARLPQRGRRLGRPRGLPPGRRGPRRGPAAARRGRRVRRHHARQLRAVPHPLARLDRARPRQDARPARDRRLPGRRARAQPPVLTVRGAIRRGRAGSGILSRRPLQAGVDDARIL